MPQRYTRLVDTGVQITTGLDRIRTELEVDAVFPADVETEAASAVRDVELPDLDLTDIPFVTVDPEGSKDLDQALHIVPNGSGHIVHYAIADLPLVVRPGGLVDAESQRRGQTLYAPDGSVPLHPRSISEDGASLLAGKLRSAYVWEMHLDGDGNVTATTLRRARITSRARLSYPEAQERIVSGDNQLGPLRQVGEQRITLEAARGGASLDMPEEEIVHAHGVWRIERRELLPVEQWNAQISLMTGMEAARLQLSAGAGIIRTMPRPSEEAIAEFRGRIEALGLTWAQGTTYGEFLRTLDRTRPASLAVLNAARTLFRGAGYRIIDGPISEPDAVHAAIGAPYAHTTAPLRRLVDRYSLAFCEAIANNRPLPSWATETLAVVPPAMQASGSLAGKLERESLALVTREILRPRVGEHFDGIVIEARGTSSRVELIDPPVDVSVPCEASPGSRVRVELVSIDAEGGDPVFRIV